MNADPSVLNEIKTLLKLDFQNFQNEVDQALDQKDNVLLRSAIHRLSPIVKIIEFHKMDELISSLRSHDFNDHSAAHNKKETLKDLLLQFFSQIDAL